MNINESSGTFEIIFAQVSISLIRAFNNLKKYHLNKVKQYYLLICEKERSLL